jgi:DNA-binding CsgD family transcriptional regulator/DNA-binding XRE family transcriptional regulator
VSVEDRLAAASRRLKLMRAFGKQLQSLRAQADLSPQHLAERCSLPVSVVTRAEKGQTDPRLTLVQTLAMGLQVALSVLVEPPGYSPTAGLSRDSSKDRILSHREREVVRLIAAGFTNPQIAEELQVSLRTVKTYRARATRKLSIRSRVEITAYARRTGLAD